MKVGFSKIHGIGNDFIVISEMKGAVIPEKRKPDFAGRFCTRRLSVGADGVLFLQPSKKADFRMRVFNADGSEAENCVNGLRCASLLFFSMSGKREMTVETLAGLFRVKVVKEEGSRAIFELEFRGKREYRWERKVTIGKNTYTYNFVDMGNPHAVIFMKSPVGDFPVADVGRAIELHGDFRPNRTNVEFVNVPGNSSLEMRVWERGVGETMACGSGSIAAVIAAQKKGFCPAGKWVKVRQPGGVLEIMLGEALLLRGPAEISFSGEVEW